MSIRQPSFYTRDGKQIAIMKKILFDDGIERFICTHDHVPECYWPNTVYIYNELEDGYIQTGVYTKKETRSTEWFNIRTNSWEGNPSIKTYYYSLE